MYKNTPFSHDYTKYELLDTLHIQQCYMEDRLTCSRAIHSGECHHDITSQGTSCSGTHHHRSSILRCKVGWALNTNLYSCVWKAIYEVTLMQRYFFYCNNLLQSLNCTQPSIHTMHIFRDILLSSSSMVTVVVDGFKVTALSPVVRDTVKDSVLSTTVSPVMGIITVWFVVPALNVRSMDTVV